MGLRDGGISKSEDIWGKGLCPAFSGFPRCYSHLPERAKKAEKGRKGRGLFKGGNGRGGFHTPVRGTMFVRDGAVTPGPSRECDITFFVKRRPNSARQSRDSTVAARRVQSVTAPSSRVSRELSLPRVKVPRLKKCRKKRISADFQEARPDTP